MVMVWQSCHLVVISLSENFKFCGPFFQQACHSSFFVLPLGKFLPREKGWSQLTTLNVTMKNNKVLQLGLQLSFLVATNTCNSWYS
jgi:hypothetical protein